jgi:hypothetical protein
MLSQDDFEKALEILSRHCTTPADTRPLIETAFYGKNRLINNIDINGAPLTVANNIVTELKKLSCINIDGKSVYAVWIFFHKNRDRFGSQDQEWIDKNLASYQNQCQPELSPIPILSNYTPKIHILVSAKGGVGKTLIGLSALASYIRGRMRSRRLLIIDINTTNNDLYHLVPAAKKNQIIPRSDWRYSEISSSCHIFSKEPFHQLPNSGVGFWNFIRQAVEKYKDMIKGEYKDLIKSENDFDIFIDTNLHPANILPGGAFAGDEDNDPLSTAIKGLIKEEGEQKHQINLWMVWTWGALSAGRAAYIETAMKRAKTTFKDNMRIIHVLNPNAIIDPNQSVKYLDKFINKSNEIFVQTNNIINLMNNV